MPLAKAHRLIIPFALFIYNTVSGQAGNMPGNHIKGNIPLKATDTMVFVKDSSHTDAFMEDLLKQYPQYFDSILANRKAYNVQVIYTKIDRGANGIAALKNYYFNVNAGHYFYPAGAVKLPIGIIALQKLDELKATGIDKNTTMLTEAGYAKQTAVYNDPATPDGKPTLHQYFKKMLTGGEEDAVNRLYEFTGQQYINDQLQQKGYSNAQVTQRLGIVLTEEQNRHNNPIRFVGAGNKLIYQQPMQYNSKPYLHSNDSLGKAWYEGDKLINHPMSFSGNNRISLEDLHNMMISLIFPNKVTAAQRFNINADDKNYLLKYMSQLPAETIYPPYNDDTVNYYPACNKYLLYGAEKAEIAKSIRIFNVSGAGYGQLIDVAYIADLDKKIEFFLSAVIYCNSDGVLNDEHDDYDTTGFPFMKHLGQVIYEYEVKREKKIQPDLSELIFDYDRK